MHGFDLMLYDTVRIGGRYINAGFTAGTAYTRLNSPNGIYAFDPYAMIGTKTMLGQTVSTVNPTTGAVTDLFKSSQFNVDSQESFAIGASYVIGNTMISGNYTYTTIKGYGQSSHMHVGEGGGSYKFTPALILYGGYQFTAFEGHKWNMGSLGLHYFFSKRTDIYMSGDYLSGSNGVDAVIGYSFTPSRSSTQSDLRVGMRHSF
jgi:outer membrane protein OmpU